MKATQFRELSSKQLSAALRIGYRDWLWWRWCDASDVIKAKWQNGAWLLDACWRFCMLLVAPAWFRSERNCPWKDWVDMSRTIVLESFWPNFSHMTKVSMCISIVRGLFGHCSPETEREIDTDASDAEVFNLCCHLLTCEMSVCPWYSMSFYHPYIIMKKTNISGRHRRLWQPHGQGLKLRKARGKKRCSAETEVVKSKSEIRQKSLHKPRTFFWGLIWRFFFVILYSTTESLNRRLVANSGKKLVRSGS